MPHATRFVAAVAVLVALALCVPVQAQTPLIDALRVRAEAEVADAQSNVGVMYANGKAFRRMTSKRRCGPTSPSLSLPARSERRGKVRSRCS